MQQADPKSEPYPELGARVLIVKDVRENLAEGQNKSGAVGTYSSRTAVAINLFLAGKHVGQASIAEYEAPATNENACLADDYPFYPDGLSLPRPIPHKFAVPAMSPVITFDDGSSILGVESFWSELKPEDNPAKVYWIQSRLFDKQVELSERARKIEDRYAADIAALNQEGEEYREQMLRAAEEVFSDDHGTFVVEVGKPKEASDAPNVAQDTPTAA